MKKLSNHDKKRLERLKFSEEFWKPITESGELGDGEFDTKFPIDRTFLIDYPESYSGKQKERIRFVKHPDCQKDEIKIFTTSIFETLPKDRWIGGNTVISGICPGYRHEKRAKITNTSTELIMKIKDVEEKYGINLSR